MNVSPDRINDSPDRQNFNVIPNKASRHPLVARGEHLAVSTLAQVAPSLVSHKGIAKKMSNPRVSQAITSRGVTTLDVPSGQTVLFGCQPMGFGATDIYDLWFLTGTTANVTAGTGSSQAPYYLSPAAATGATYTGLTTDCPYPIVQFDDEISCRLVGCSIRITNVTRWADRGGTLTYYASEDGSLAKTFSAAGRVGDLYNAVNSSTQATVFKHFANGSDVDIMVPVTLDDWDDDLIDSRDYVDRAFSYSHGGTFSDKTLSGNTNAYVSLFNPQPYMVTNFGRSPTSGVPVAIIGASPNLVGYFTNGSNSSQTLQFQMVQHWEYCGKSLHHVSTPPVSHNMSQDLVQSAVQHLTTQHGLTPHLPFTEVIKAGVKLAQNKHVREAAKVAASVLMAL